MGTVFRIEVLGGRVAQATIADAVGLLHRVDEVFSPYRPDSAISRLGRGELAMRDCPPEVAGVADLCADAYRRTEGYFTPAYHGGFDPTGLVKGWSIERVHDLLVAAGSVSHSINGGGDIRVFGTVADGTPWEIGITDPTVPGSCIAVVPGTDIAVATSGTYERGQHVINPFTGEPARELVAATVLYPDTALADAFATAMLAMGRAAIDWAGYQPDLEALTVGSDGAIRWTAGFPARTGAG